MAAGDVWVLGAGASADSGAPTIPSFRTAATQIQARLEGKEAGAFRSVLDFWGSRLPFLDIEQFFGFIDTPEMAASTGEGNLSDLRRQTLFLIAKVITTRLRARPSPAHKRFVEACLEEFVPVITLNWDILLEEALLDHERKVDYAIPKVPPWDPHKTFRPAQLVFKLHGSLNWLHCDKCSSFSFLDEKTRVPEFLLTGAGLSCSYCGNIEGLNLLMVPPVLSKLGASETIRAVWTEAYKILAQAKRVFIVGYSFPPTDLQTRLFIQKALRDSKTLETIHVITRPKYGTSRITFEDRYVEALGGPDLTDKVLFTYKTFLQFVQS